MLSSPNISRCGTEPYGDWGEEDATGDLRDDGAMLLFALISMPLATAYKLPLATSSVFIDTILLLVACQINCSTEYCVRDMPLANVCA